MDNKFVLIGAAGFVAPRHMKAIQDNGAKLVAAVDPVDSIGILDSYGLDIEYYKHVNTMENNISRLGVNWVSIASPNYLHAEHCIRAIGMDCDVICEKPLCLSEKEIDTILNMECKHNKTVYPVLQLREHSEINRLKQYVTDNKKYHNVNLTYFTPRGKWYHESWKGYSQLSGGLLMNIGVHFVDMLIWIFGQSTGYELQESTNEYWKGDLFFERGQCSAYLSIETKNPKADRSLLCDGEVFDFTTGFTDLHSAVYKKALAGIGYKSVDAFPAIKLVNEIRGETL